jgi:glycosyltransferase involved in cell wall biosynthesis
MKLDVVVPTYNRSKLLRTVINSLLRAPVPAGLDVTIWVVDNNSKDDTVDVVSEIQSTAAVPCMYVNEANQGSSQARNAGIRAGNGELIGFIDDDEQIDERWYEIVAREFADQETQFIAGAYLPNWEVPAPNWLHPMSHAAIGVTASMPRSLFGGESSVELWSGNAVIRRSAFEEIGLFSTKYGRGAADLMMNEDFELQDRMVRAGYRGIYVPDLMIYHLIPAGRLTRNYHRRWRYWNGVSAGLSGRDFTEPVRYAFGIPRYKIGQAIRGLLSLPRHLLINREVSQAFADELPTWFLLGYVYGKHFMRQQG